MIILRILQWDSSPFSSPIGEHFDEFASHRISKSTLTTMAFSEPSSKKLPSPWQHGRFFSKAPWAAQNATWSGHEGAVAAVGTTVSKRKIWQNQAGSTIRTLLHDKINPKNCQVLETLGDSGFLPFFRVVSRDYGKIKSREAPAEVEFGRIFGMLRWVW